ncbi:MAG: DoxX family protein [Saprospiraceae bacterium]|nr:DoxX family protein [Saprospiraceae bacterium]
MTTHQSSKVLHISLWVVQILLAAAFGMAGFLKISLPLTELAAKGMGFVNHTPEMMVRFIGASELAGALGLILPAVLRIKPILTPIAAAGLAVIMLLAAKEHIEQNESVMANVILFLLASFVAWGRFTKAPIQAKN